MADGQGFNFGERRPPRRWSLTPMIDVVFLLLVFFMLAAQFGTEKALPLGAAGSGGGEYRGAPRLIDLGATGLRLNGRPVAAEALVAELVPLMPDADAIVILRPEPGVPLERAVQIVDLLRAAGIRRVIMAGPGG